MRAEAKTGREYRVLGAVLSRAALAPEVIT